jgi:hypothetical protein
MLILLRAMLILRHYAADAIFDSAMPSPLFSPPPLSPLFTPPLMPLRHYYFSMLSHYCCFIFLFTLLITLRFSLFSAASFDFFTFTSFHIFISSLSSSRLITEASLRLHAFAPPFSFISSSHISSLFEFSFHISSFSLFHYAFTISLPLHIAAITPLLP